MKKIIVAALFFASASSFAASINLQSLTDDDFNKIIKEFSANQSFYSVSPASSLGKVWGVEVGAVGGVAKSPELDRINKSFDATAKDLNLLPHAGILARIGVPFGITGEALYFPKQSREGVSYKEMGGALQWTVTDVFFTSLPLSLAVKGSYISSSLAFDTTLNNSTTSGVSVPVSAKLSDKVTEAEVLASREFLSFFEPYVGVGYVKSKGTLSVDGAASAYGFSAALGQSATSKPNSAKLTAGFNARLFFLVLGADYNKVFGTDVYNAKLSFRF